MAAPRRQLYTLTQIVGMNTTDPEMSLPPGQVRFIENMDLLQGGLGSIRSGFIDGPVGASQPQGAIDSDIVALFRHAPDGEDATAELWAIRRRVSVVLTPTIYRYAAGVWTELFFPGPDFPSWVDGDTWSFATFNRKLFIAAKTVSGSQAGPGVNRLHVWDGVSIRRVGLAPPATAPALVNIGAGALNFSRFYRVRFATTVGAPPALLRSEAGPSASITIAASAGVRVFRPALVDGNEQGWDVEAANTANGPWFVLANVGIGTLTFDDTNATIPTIVPAPEAGLFTLPPSAKYLAVYQNQLIMAGAWETTAIAGESVPKNNRVWFTRPLGALEVSDDEAITTTLTLKFYVDTGEDNDRINGLSYPLNGIPYVTKRRQFWSLIPRDNDTAPFAAVRLTDSVGCRDFRTIVIGEDEMGDPALYWNSLRGPYRMVRGGMQYLGRDLEGDGTPTTNALGQCDRAIWLAERRQVWWMNSDGQFFYFVFNVRFGRSTELSDVRNGWTQALAAATNPRIPRAMCVFGAQFQPADALMQPVFGGRDLSNVSFLWQAEPSASTDVGSQYAITIRSGELALGDLFYNVSVYPPRVYGTVNEAIPTTLTWTLWRNFTSEVNEAPQTSTIVLSSQVGTAFRHIAAFEGINQSDGEIFQFAIASTPTPNLTGLRLFAVIIPYQRQEEAWK